MKPYEFFTIIALLAGGFGWMISWLRSISKSVSDIDKRLSRFEGRFEERGYWESRQYHKTGTEEK